jgi:hypothetical protein
MKSKFFTGSMLLISGFFAVNGEQDITKIWNDPDPFLEKIRRQISKHHRNHEEDKALAGDLKTLAYAISVELNAAESPNWAMPSAERKAVIQKWANILKPETQSLVDLAFGEGFGESRSSIQARSLLDYAPSTSDFGEQVRKYMHQSLKTAFVVADLLYEHRLLTDADKETLREWRPDTNQAFELEGWAVGMSSFGILDGLTIAKRSLSMKPQGETPKDITRQYLNLLRIVNHLGPNAAILLPEIEELIAEPAIISSGYLNHFEYARDVITGKEPSQDRYAINGSGALSSWLERSGFVKPEAGASVVKSSGELKSLSEQEKKLVPETEESSSPSRWPLSVALIVVAFCLLWRGLKKQK